MHERSVFPLPQENNKNITKQKKKKKKKKKKKWMVMISITIRVMRKWENEKMRKWENENCCWAFYMDAPSTGSIGRLKVLQTS